MLKNRTTKLLTHQLITKKMAVVDVDVHQCAVELIKQCGVDAPAEARVNAQQCAAAGDSEAEALWQRIAGAVDDMLKRGDGTLH